MYNIQDIVNVIIANCEELKLIETVKNASIKGNEGCGTILYQLNILMDDIKENDSNWFGKDTRTKRHVLSELVSDDWPYASLFETFTNMSKRGSETSTSPDKETSYVMSSMNLSGKSADRLAIREYVANQLSVVHNTLVAARNGSVNAVRLFQLRTIIQDIISYQTLILTTFASKQKQYLPLVGMKNVQILSLISSDTLFSELNNIRNVVIEKGLGFPMKITSENVHFLFQMSSPEIAFYRDQVFVTFKLPLISKHPGNYYSLIKVTSALTSIIENVYGYVAPNHEFLAIDAHKEKYITLTVDDLNDCRQMINTTSMICRQTSIAMQASTSSDIEINIFLDQKNERKDQVFLGERYIRNDAPIFIKVLKPNSWLVTMPQVRNVRYMCDGKYTQESLVQINGLLTIGNNCKFSTGNVVLVGHNILRNSLIFEHEIGNSSKKWSRQDDLNKILKDDDVFVNNNVTQVISFGESEKLFRISFTNDEINTKLHISTMKENLDDLEVSLIVFVSAVYLAIFAFLAWIKVVSKKRRDRQQPATTNSRDLQPSAPLYPSVAK